MPAMIRPSRRSTGSGSAVSQQRANGELPYVSWTSRVAQACRSQSLGTTLHASATCPSRALVTSDLEYPGGHSRVFTVEAAESTTTPELISKLSSLGIPKLTHVLSILDSPFYRLANFERLSSFRSHAYRSIIANFMLQPSLESLDPPPTTRESR